LRARDANAAERREASIVTDVESEVGTSTRRLLKSGW
jgi:hypothetical protein